MTSASEPSTAVLVHGAWHGSWLWDQVRRGLTAAGMRSESVDLPSADTRLGGLDDDVASIDDAVDQTDGPVVLVAHSYAGLPASVVAARSTRVVAVVYVCAFIVPQGTSLLDTQGGKPPTWWVTDAEGLTMLPAEPETFYTACSRAVSSGAVARLQPHAVKSVTEALPEAAYGEIRADYVLCTRDALFPAAAQRACADLAGATVHQLDADHTPMLSRPNELTEVIAAALRASAPAARTH